MSDNPPETAETEELAHSDRRQISHQPNSSPRQDHLVAQRITHNMEEKPVEASSGTPAVVVPPNETDVGFGKLTSSEHKDSAEINKPYEPVRTIPLRSLDTKRRRLDRLTDETVPEVHIVGQLTYGKRLTHEISEGAFCRYKIDIGKSFQPLGGELMGQTQVAYGRNHMDEPLLLNHPIDLHFGMAGLQGWGSPRVSIQSFRLDWLGRKILNGYGFAHLPLSPGKHVLEINLWRPIGTPNQELRAYLLGETPALVTQDPLYESAWKDRCRLLTTSCGSIKIELFVITRFLKEQGIIQSTVG